MLTHTDYRIISKAFTRAKVSSNRRPCSSTNPSTLHSVQALHLGEQDCDAPDLHSPLVDRATVCRVRTDLTICAVSGCTLSGSRLLFAAGRRYQF